MWDKLRAILTGEKLHDFDLENPEDVYVQGTTQKLYSFHRYKCKKCGKILALDLWQMQDLPWEQKIGCDK